MFTRKANIDIIGLRTENDIGDIFQTDKPTIAFCDHELLKGITNAEYHYRGSAKIMAQIGKAFAEAVAPESSR